MDRWGRPTFEDGVQMYQGLRMIQQDKQAAADRKTEQDSYVAAGLIAKGEDVSTFAPETQYKASQLHWQDKINETQAQVNEYRLSEAGRKKEAAEAQANLAQATEKLNQYKVLRQSVAVAQEAGNVALAKQYEQKAKALAVDLNNKHMFTGRYIEPGEDGYQVTNWGGTQELIQDIPLDQVDQLLGAYFERPQEEILKWGFGAKQQRTAKNAEIMAQAQPYYNKQTGEIIRKVPAGTWGPDGKPRGEYFVDAQGKNEVQLTDGFVPLGEAAAVSTIESRNKTGGGSDPAPYHQFIQTSEGIYSGNSRSGELVKKTNERGEPILPISADVDLVQAKEEAKGRGQFAAYKQKTFPKIRDTNKALNRQWTFLESTIDKALDAVSPYTAGVGAWASVIPSAPQKDLKETLETIKANIGFDKLQEMRNNSPTGGALGQVSEFENKLLQAVQGSLDQSQSASQLRENLKGVKNLLGQVKEQHNSAFQSDYGDILKGQSQSGQYGNRTDSTPKAKTAQDYLKTKFGK